MMMRSNQGGQVRGVVLVVVAVVAVVVGVAVGVFVPQVHQAYVTETETSTLHTTETESHTVHTTESLFTTATDTRTETITETEALTYTQKTTATEMLTTTIITTITPTETIPPGYEVYSKFGFSFEYPEGMTILELGLLESAPTDDSGMALGTLENDEYEIITVAWTKMATAPPLESSLQAGLAAMETSPGATDLEIGELVETTKAGHRMLYQYFNVTILAKELYGIYGLWYCDMSERFYQLYLMYSEEDVLPIYQEYLDSFVCHP